MDHTSPAHESDDDDRREMRRDKFKRERDEEENRRNEREFAVNAESSYKRERYNSPDRRKPPQQRYDEPYNRRRSDNYDNNRDRDQHYGRDSRRYRDESPGADRRRESPPMKRRKGEDSWDRDRSPSPRYKGSRSGRGRSSWPSYDEYDRDRELRERDRERERNYEREESPDYYSGAKTRASKGIRNNAALFDGPMKSFKQFLDLLDDNSGDANKMYEEYQNEYKRRQLLVFFNEHKIDEWFKEKYEPSYLEQKRLEKLEVAKQNAKSFMEAFQNGTLEFNLTSADVDVAIKEALQPTENKETDTAVVPEGEKMDVIKEEIKDVDKTETPDKKIDNEPSNVLFIKVVPPFVSRNELLEVFKKVPGYRKLALSEPMRFKNFNRLGWVSFDTPEACSNALKELMGRTKIKDFEIHMMINKQQDVHKLPKLTPPVAAEEARIKIDVEQAKLLCMQLDKEKGIQDNPVLNLSGLSPAELLDRIIVYLRKVHFFCYYCGDEFDDEDELTRKCEKHLRGPKKDADMSLDITTDQWALSLDTKIKNRTINPNRPDVYTGKERADKKTEKFLNRHTVKIEEEKYRCSLCQKLFMGEAFVKKHIGLKHPEKIEEIRKKVLEKQFFENYCNDPKRINPNPAMIPTTSGTRGGGRGRGNAGYSQATSYNANVFPVAQPAPFYSPQGGYSQRGGSGRGRRGGGRYQGEQQQHSRPLEPPPGMSPDPRAMRTYVDLDAPSEDVVQIDYRTALDIHKELKAKERKD